MSTISDNEKKEYIKIQDINKWEILTQTEKIFKKLPSCKKHNNANYVKIVECLEFIIENKIEFKNIENKDKFIKKFKEEIKLRKLNNYYNYNDNNNDNEKTIICNLNNNNNFKKNLNIKLKLC